MPWQKMWGSISFVGIVVAGVVLICSGNILLIVMGVIDALIGLGVLVLLWTSEGPGKDYVPPAGLSFAPGRVDTATVVSHPEGLEPTSRNVCRGTIGGRPVVVFEQFDAGFGAGIFTISFPAATPERLVILTGVDDSIDDVEGEGVNPRDRFVLDKPLSEEVLAPLRQVPMCDAIHIGNNRVSFLPMGEFNEQMEFFEKHGEMLATQVVPQIEAAFVGAWEGETNPADTTNSDADQGA